MATLQAIASLGADVEFGDVTGAFLESAELRSDEGKLYLQQAQGGLPGFAEQQLWKLSCHRMVQTTVWKGGS